MELITAYLYNTSPFETRGISSTTFHHLKRDGWFKDVRSTVKFQIFNKRFKIQDKWFRTIIRFTQQENGTYELNTPIPFIIAETKAQNEEETVFKDIKTYHGRKVGNTTGYLNEGVPVELLTEVFADLKEKTIYTVKAKDLEDENTENHLSDEISWGF